MISITALIHHEKEMIYKAPTALKWTTFEIPTSELMKMISIITFDFITCMMFALCQSALGRVILMSKLITLHFPVCQAIIRCWFLDAGVMEIDRQMLSEDVCVQGGTHLKRWYGYVRQSRPPFHTSPAVLFFRSPSCSMITSSLDPHFEQKYQILTPTSKICKKNWRIFSSAA